MKVQFAASGGANFIDTANLYSLGESETLTGNAIKCLGLPRDEIIVATKATGMDETAVNARVELSAEEMTALDEVSALPAEYPGWMSATQGQYRAKPPVKP
jgi:aryl-alcohol dehydrogenase-like predicted oxidoreductase